MPSFFLALPEQLSIWGNDRYGVCVTAEEAAAKAQYSVACGLAETFVDEKTVIAWAKKHRVLNGATLTEVMDAMIEEGITATDGKLYKNGPYQSVDWTDDADLSSAIYAGPVKIAISADQLDGVVEQSNGWVATGFRRDQGIDHCVNLCGFGTAQELTSALQAKGLCGAVDLEAAEIDPNARCYAMFTWGTIGIIDRDSMIAITGEAWLRIPTTVGQEPSPTPTPTPEPEPIPVPPPAPEPDPTPSPTPGPWCSVLVRLVIMAAREIVKAKGTGLLLLALALLAGVARAEDSATKAEVCTSDHCTSPLKLGASVAASLPADLQSAAELVEKDQQALVAAQDELSKAKAALEAATAKAKAAEIAKAKDYAALVDLLAIKYDGKTPPPAPTPPASEATIYTFTASSCLACKPMEAIWYQVRQDGLNILMYKDVTFPEKYRITGTPTTLIYVDGKEVWRKVGAATVKEIEQAYKDVVPKTVSAIGQ